MKHDNVAALKIIDLLDEMGFTTDREDFDYDNLKQEITSLILEYGDQYD